VSDQQDRQLREALRGVQAPPPGEDARERVRAAVGAAAATAAAEPTPAAPAAAEQPVSRRSRLSAVFAGRRRLAFGLAALAAVALVAGLLLVGPPGGGGPEPVRASQVLQRALRALSSGRTLAAEVTIRERTNGVWTTPARYDVDRYGLLLSADGSYRLAGRGGSKIGWLAGAGSHQPIEVVYNARRGVLSTYSREWGLIERYGYPPGPPDRWAGLVTQFDFSAEGRALEAAGATRLRTTVYEDRPAWAITCSWDSGPSRPAIDDDGFHFEITIDKATAFPVCFKGFLNDALTFEVRYSNVRVDAPLPDGAFELKAPAGAPLRRIPDGFRRAPLARIARLPGFTTLVPASVPRGYRLTQAAAAPYAVTANRMVKGRKVVALQYARGFDSLTVTTRRVADAWSAARYDPLELDQDRVYQVAWPATIRAGAFRGVTAQVVVAPVTTTPHLWAVKDGVLLTIAGSATAEELLAVAASLEPASR
jgi:hypothetical protein